MNRFAPSPQKQLLGLVFSRDRALQLDATLKSFLQHCRDPHAIQLAVLYSNTSPAFDRRYESLRQTYPEVQFVQETSFRTQLLDLVADYAGVLFLVDDNIFVNGFSVTEMYGSLTTHRDAIGVSLRLGRNTTACFTLNQPQRVPEMQTTPEQLLKYRWPGTDCDFGYPLEVSSSLYRAADILPILRRVSFKNPNTLEVGLAGQAATLRRRLPWLLCCETSRAFCVPLNLVQKEFANRIADDTGLSAAVLGERYDTGWRIDTGALAGFVPPACHHVLPLPQIHDPSLTVTHPAPADAPSTTEPAAPLTVSIVIPCFNQGRFLTDCLESLACQTVPPLDVLVVNDGSTDRETLELFERLADYHYPFSLQVLHKPNGGISSARNYGIDRCRGEIIIPLDGDDKLIPTALESYCRAFTRQPEVDVFYPDIAAFGTDSWTTPGPSFNAWRLVLDNFMACASAIRRRVFAAGNRYDEGLRNGVEDWEFWMRTCALGALTAAPLQEPVFCYRKWGHSMLATVDQQKVIGEIRSRHASFGLWNAETESRLRKQHAPSHCVITDKPAGWEAQQDLRTAPATGIARTLAEDRSARFVWFGSCPAEWSATLQLAIGELSSQRPTAAAFSFIDADSRQPYGVVFDRLWTLLRPFRYHRPALETGPVISIETSGHTQPLIRKLSRQRRLGVAEQAILPPCLHNARQTDLLPRGHDTDPRVSKDVWLSLERAPERPRRVAPRSDERVLVIALSWLLYGGAELATLAFLEEGSVRSQFDRIVLLVFENDTHPVHARFEPLVDTIIHLGQLGLTDEAKLEIGCDLCQAVGATDLFINNSRHGYEMIPRLRKAGIPIRISAQIHGFEFHPSRQTLTEGYPRLLASRYANLIDRVASISENLTSRMTDELYFPRTKIRTVRLGIDQSQFRLGTRSGPSDSPQIAWVGRLHPGKDPLLALEVAEEYHRRQPGARFVFVGDGPLAATFAKRLQRARKSGVDVQWIPQTDHVAAVLQDSDCLFMTTRHEGIPIVVMEAFSCGLPVVMCLANTAAAELAACGAFYEITDRTSVHESCERLQQAVSTGRAATQPPELSRERYAREMLNWLFDSNLADAPAQLTSVFGVNAAA